MTSFDRSNNSFDFDAYLQRAVTEYQRKKADYEGYANEIANLLEKAFRARQIPFASIEKRAKRTESFKEKASRRSLENLDLPRYLHPLIDIEDLAGIRVITYFLKTIEDVDKVIYELFDVKDKLNKGEGMERNERFGYQSIHYIVTFTQDRLRFLELSCYAEMKAEIQVRTILQHAWAEIEHDIQYKSVEIIPATIRRRFSALAGLLEIADREFQAIQDEDKQLKVLARRAVEENKLEEVEITSDAVKAYLDKLLGSDARVTETSYDLIAEVLHQIGFKNFREIDECISEYVDINKRKDLSRIAWRAKQGQIMRFETLLLVAMGESFIRRHPRKNEIDFNKRYSQALSKLRQAGIDIGKYSQSQEHIS